MPQSTSSPTEPRLAPGRAAAPQSGAQEKAQARTRRKREPKAEGKPQAGPATADDSGAPPGGWVVYLLRCVDGTLYCGCTNDLERRLGRHRRGDVKYTRGRLPVEVAYCEEAGGRGEALRREAALKRLSRGRKLHLCATHAARSPVPKTTRKEGARADERAKAKAKAKAKAPGKQPERQPDKRRSAAPKL